MNLPHVMSVRPMTRAPLPVCLAAVALIGVGLSGCATGSAQATPSPATPGEAVSETANLTIRFDGLAPATGVLRVGVFAGQDAYDSGPAARGATAAVTGPSMTVAITDLSPGAYGLKVFHDVNGDGKLNTNPFGIPTEPYAFSNNARGSFGPAAWSDAHFTITAGANTHSIRFQ